MDVKQVQREVDAAITLLGDATREVGTFGYIAFDSRAIETRTPVEIIERAQELSLGKVTKVLDAVGWPDPKVYGENTSRMVCYVLLDAAENRPGVREMYLPVARKALEEGKIDPLHYAMLEDRVQIARDGTQIFGTQYTSHAGHAQDYRLTRYKSDVKLLHPIQDAPTVNARRAAIGLNQTIEKAADQCGIDMSKGIPNAPTRKATAPRVSVAAENPDALTLTSEGIPLIVEESLVP